MKRLSLKVIISICVLLIGCGKGVNFSQESLTPNPQPKQDVIVPECEIDIPQLSIQGRVLDFSVDKSGGGSIGYGGIQGVEATLSFKASFAELALTLDAKDYMVGHPPK